MEATRYARPAALADAVALLAAGGWRVLAGGTDVYPAHVGRPLAGGWVDITRIAALRGIRADADGWTFGATTTWTDVVNAKLPPLFDALKQAAREVGGVQIQNSATIAGNLCNASPAADGIPAWLALDAQVVVAGAAGERRIAIADFVLGARRTALQPGELVAAIHVPMRDAGARSVFLKLGGRRYLVISVTMVALVVEPDAQGRVAAIRAAVGSCAARALRLPALEARLTGAPLASLAQVDVTDTDLAPLTPIDDLRGSAAYRRDASATLLRRALAALAEEPR